MGGAGSDAVVAVLVCDDGLLQAVNNVLARTQTEASTRMGRKP
jgi:hypothetical protein